MEHLHHFGLSQDPFSNESDLRLYVESPAHRDAQRRVERGLRQHKGLTLLTGEGGMGKTLLARRILDGLEEEIFESTLLVMLPGAADAMGIFQRFARQLGADEPARDRAGVLSQIYERLAIVREDGRHAVLIVDDAQVMTAQVFAELGGLLSLEYEDRRLMSMLFVGSLELDRQIQNDASLSPRVDVRVRIQPLDLPSATAYLMHRLKVARGRPELIPPATLEALYKASRGRPRLLNTLADNALFEAYLAGRHSIDPGDVERAAADLGLGLGMNPVEPAAPVVREIAPPRVASAPVASSAAPAMRPAPPQAHVAAASLADLDLDSELVLTEALGAEASEGGVASAFDVDDILGPEPVRARPAPQALSRAPHAAPVAQAPAPADELEGLIAELIEE